MPEKTGPLPAKRTWARWRRLAWRDYSLLRGMEYEAIAGLCLRGVTLDIGGGAKNSYHHLLRVEGRIETINLDPILLPTHVWDINRPLPFEDGQFDNVISLNTFEHICDDQLAIAEALRVLRVGGEFHFLVPFLYRVHGSPSDYHRHTAHWWREFLIRASVDPGRFIIVPLAWDPRSTARSLTGLRGGIQRAVLLAAAFIDIGGSLRRILEQVPALRGKFWRPAGERQLARALYAADYALSYYIHGTK